MIASTFTQRLSLAYYEEVFQTISKLSLTGKYKFLMVLHPKMPLEIIEKWKSLKNEHFTFYDTTDLIPLFRQADFMFADTTSAIQEFLLQRKPVVTFRHARKKDYLIQIHEAGQIEAAFKTAIHCPEEMMNNIEKYILELHPYFDGRSSERLISATIDFLHKDKRLPKIQTAEPGKKIQNTKALALFYPEKLQQAFSEMIACITASKK